MKVFFKKLFGIKEKPLYPFNYKSGDYPELVEGDILTVILQNQKYDYIAGTCGMGIKDAEAGTVRKFKVKKVFDDRDYLIEGVKGKEKILIKPLNWLGSSNEVCLKPNLMHGEEFYKFYHSKEIN